MVDISILGLKCRPLFSLIGPDLFLGTLRTNTANISFIRVVILSVKKSYLQPFEIKEVENPGNPPLIINSPLRYCSQVIYSQSGASPGDLIKNDASLIEMAKGLNVSAS